MYSHPDSDEAEEESTGQHWLVTALIALATFGLGIIITVLLVGWWYPAPEEGPTPAGEDRVSGVTCAKSDLQKCPWDYKSFHLGDWADIGYPLCAGKAVVGAPHNELQSPVDLPLVAGLPETTEKLELNAAGGGCKKLGMENNPHTFESSFHAEGCTSLTAKWKGKMYTMQQFHFHSESENKVNKEHMAGEMHMVHTSTDGNVLVIGVFLTPGTPGNAFLNRMFDSGFKPTHVVDTEEAVNPYAGVLNTTSTFYSYLGSFTTPPCTANVEWLSFTEPVPIAPEDLQTFKAFLGTQWQPDAYGFDYRPVQPLNGRLISLGRGVAMTTS